jgi:hypothetical protein
MFVSAMLATADLARAEAQVESRSSPKDGPWRNQPVGAFVLFESTAYDTGHVFRREILLGLTADNRAVILIQQSGQPDGPWTKKTVITKGSEEPAGEAKPLGHKTFDVAGQQVICEGTQYTATDVDSSTTVDRWIDPETGRRVLTRQVIRPRGVSGLGSVRVIEDRLVKVAEQKVGNMTVTAGEYDSNTRIDGQLQMSRRYLFSDDVPGQRVVYQRWAGAPGQVRTAVDDKAIAFGEVPEVVDHYLGKSSTTMPATTQP